MAGHRPGEACSVLPAGCRGSAPVRPVCSRHCRAAGAAAFLRRGQGRRHSWASSAVSAWVGRQWLCRGDAGCARAAVAVLVQLCAGHQLTRSRRGGCRCPHLSASHVPTGTRCSVSYLHYGCIPLKNGSRFCRPSPWANTAWHPPFPVTTGQPHSSGTALRLQCCWLPSLAPHPPDPIGVSACTAGSQLCELEPCGLSSLPVLKAAAHIWQTSAVRPRSGSCRPWRCPRRSLPGPARQRD